MNRVSMLGRLTKDPELKTIGDDISVCNFDIAVDRRFQKSNEEKNNRFF